VKKLLVLFILSQNISVVDFMKTVNDFFKTAEDERKDLSLTE
jgi:hypothetical protein